MPSSQPCCVCGTPTASRCPTCKIDYYCSRECQLMVYKTHHKICKAGSSFFIPSLSSRDMSTFLRTAAYSKKTLFEAPSYHPFMPQLKSIRLFDGTPEELIEVIEDNTLEEPRRSFILFLLYDRVSLNDQSGRNAPDPWYTFSLFFARIIDTLVPHYVYRDPSTRRSFDDFAILSKKLIIFYDLLYQHDMNPPGPPGFKQKLEWTHGELGRAYRELSSEIDPQVRGKIKESVDGATMTLMSTFMQDEWRSMPAKRV